MTRHALLVLGGIAFAASGVFGLVGGMLHPIVDGQSHSVASMTAPAGAIAYPLLYAGALLLMIGLPAVYGWLAPRLGVLGLVGFGLYFLGNALGAQSHLVVEGFVARDIVAARPDLVPADGSILDAPSFAGLQLVGGLAFVAGVLLAGIALLRRRSEVPRWIGGSFVATALLLFVPLPEVPILTGLQIELLEAVGCLGLGLLAVRAGRAVARAVPATPVATAPEPAVA